MIDHDAPDKLVGDFIIPMNDPVSGSNDLPGIFKPEIIVLFNYPVDGFTYDLQVAFNGSFSFDIQQILLKYLGFGFMVAFDLAYGL